MSPDGEWEALQIMQGLEVDKAVVISLVLQGKSVEADAHLEVTGYRARLAEWQRLTGKPVTAA